MTTRFTDGTQGSASQVANAFNELRTQGQAAINQLVVLRENTLLLFNNALSALNGKRVRANRLQQVGISARFVTSDLQDINQPITTASVRCDTNGVSLKERSAPGEATVTSVRFSSSEGTIQALNVPETGSSGNLGALYRVATPDGSSPVGTFDIKLLSPVSTSLILFDMMDTPSDATIVASVSQNGISYTPALSVTRNGYRLAGWFAPQEIQYIRLAITPALPDILGGNVFTFGLTDFHAFEVQYHLRSDLYTNQIQIVPQGAQLQFVTDTVAGLTYFLSLGSGPALEVSPGDIVSIPGTTVVTNQSIDITAPTGSAWAAGTTHSLGDTIVDSNGNLQTVTAVTGDQKTGSSAPVWNTAGGTTLDNHVTWTETVYAALNFMLPAQVYLPSVVIIDAGTGLALRTAPGLPKTTVGLTNQYVAIDGSGNMYLLPYNHAVDQARTFKISYVAGPSVLDVSLQVELTTSDLNTTPIFSGADLIEV